MVETKGLCTKEFIQILIDEIELPIIVDAGIGKPSQACEAMEMGAAAVMANTAIATAGNVPAMAEAFKKAIEAGRTAYLAKLGKRNRKRCCCIITINRILTGLRVGHLTMSEERIDHMKYLPQMENIGSEIQDKGYFRNGKL